MKTPMALGVIAVFIRHSPLSPSSLPYEQCGQGRHSPSGAFSMDEPQGFHPRPGALRLIPSTAYGLRLPNGTCGPFPL